MTAVLRKSAGVVLSAVISALLFCACASAQEAKPVVDSVEVKIDFRSPAPAPIRERITSAVRNVGEKALKGKTIEEAAAVQESLTQVLKKIFGEVLSGFQVIDLSVSAGTTSTILLELEADHPQVDKVGIDVATQAGTHPEWAEHFKDKLLPIAAELANDLKGVPVGSARWSTQIITQMVRDKLAAENSFAGFELEPAVELGQETNIVITVKPVGQTVSAVNVKIRSTTIPTLLLDRLKFDMAAKAEALVGLPVEFMRAHEAEIIDFFKEYLATNSQMQRLGLEVDVKMTLVKRNVTLTVVAESVKYSGFLKGKVGIGKEKRNPDIEGHLGVFLKRTEFFSEVNFYPGPVEFKFNLGLGWRIGDRIYAAAGRNFVDDLNRIWVNYYLTEDIILAWKKNVVEDPDEKDEGSITFKAHDYFSFEVVTDFNTDVWAQLTANL